jgi:NAD(P)-dependent dehydrogenase (short-subunit alcohol dehydrogenase family)
MFVIIYSTEGTPMVDIIGRRVLVTGGQRGLGAAFTAELLARGADRVYVTARNPQPSDDPRIVPIALDVTVPATVERAAELASDVSIVINNAGMSGPMSILGTDVDAMRETFDTNVFGPVRVTQAFAPVLARHDDSALVNVHSVLSWLGGSGAYGASKAALWSLTNSLRLELAQQHTTVVGVHLGFADTDMAADFDAPKITPQFVAEQVLDGLERGDAEVLVDDISRHVKAALNGPVEELVFAH